MTTKMIRKSVMNLAWKLIKSNGCTKSVAMKAAWATIKTIIRAEEAGKACGWNYKVVANDWVKGNHNRTYIDLRIYTNAWNCKRTERFGYIDNNTGAYIAA